MQINTHNYHRLNKCMLLKKKQNEKQNIFNFSLYLYLYQNYKFISKCIILYLFVQKQKLIRRDTANSFLRKRRYEAVDYLYQDEYTILNFLDRRITTQYKSVTINRDRNFWELFVGKEWTFQLKELRYIKSYKYAWYRRPTYNGDDDIDILSKFAENHNAINDFTQECLYENCHLRELCETIDKYGNRRWLTDDNLSSLCLSVNFKLT